jgi:uncharacterized protein CbrC (UPF0167 family)
MTTLPTFRYHPNPINSGVIEASGAKCVCCGQARGHIYTGPVYSEAQGIDDAICPWCIADGAAAKKYNAEFTDGCGLHEAKLPESVINEVKQRTPGFTAWQAERWLACCGDACAFLGDAEQDDLESLDETEREELIEDWDLSGDDLDELIENYEPGGSPAVYKFKCLHCSKNHYFMDMD